MDESDLRCLERIATQGLEPDLRILLDLPVEEGLARRHRDVESVNHIDRADLAFHQRVGAAYRMLARRRPDQWAVIDATQPPDSVFAAICKAVQSSLTLTLQPAGSERQV